MPRAYEEAEGNETLPSFLAGFWGALKAFWVQRFSLALRAFWSFGVSGLLRAFGGSAWEVWGVGTFGDLKAALREETGET